MAKGDWAKEYGLGTRQIAEAQIPTARTTVIALWEALVRAHEEKKYLKGRCQSLETKIRNARRALDV